MGQCCPGRVGRSSKQIRSLQQQLQQLQRATQEKDHVIEARERQLQEVNQQLAASEQVNAQLRENLEHGGKKIQGDLQQEEPIETVPYGVGEWLPSDQAILDKWVQALIEEVDGTVQYEKPLHPVIQEFKDLIDDDAEINMFFTQMFEEVPKKRNKSPSGKPQVRDYHQMLRLFNAIMTRAPEFNKSQIVGAPICAILFWSMATIGGYAGFLNTKVNHQLKKILNEWGTFLMSKDSCYVLSTDPHKGWFGEDAKKQMPHFDEEFKCDPSKLHHGFTSWDDFFTREFRDGVRPIAAPDDDTVIVNACESCPYELRFDVQRRAKFWIKSQPYSLEHMLANDPLVDEFVGGTVYQGFLNVYNYHRWHSPVSGKIIKAYVQDGTYYSESLAGGYDNKGDTDVSQAYLTQVATRAIIFIKADNPDIGLMCFLAVGMVEISTCEITVCEGQHIKKGQQTGMFHYGGSTHCLVFRPGVNLHFDLHGQNPNKVALKSRKNIPINSKIATVHH